MSPLPFPTISVCSGPPWQYEVDALVGQMVREVFAYEGRKDTEALPAIDAITKNAIAGAHRIDTAAGVWVQFVVSRMYARAH